MTTLTNQEVYSLVQAISEISTDISLPARINFALQCNFKKLRELGEEIDKSRVDIGRKYGSLSEDGRSYNIDPDKLETANQEIMDLFTYKNEINIKKVNIDQFDKTELTISQMGTLMFMIDEEEEA